MRVPFAAQRMKIDRLGRLREWQCFMLGRGMDEEVMEGSRPDGE